VAEGIEERHRAHEVGGNRAEEEATFVECFSHQSEVELLEVSEPAVDELRGAARGPGCDVALLQQGYFQAARGGVQRSSGPCDTGPNDGDVEGFRVE